MQIHENKKKKTCLAATIIVSITDGKVIVDTKISFLFANSMVPGLLRAST